MNRLFYIICLVLPLAFASCSDDGENLPAVKPDMTGTMTDIDGNEYSWIRIGGLDWMTQNLKSGTPWYLQTYVSDTGYEYDFGVEDEDKEAELCDIRGNYYTYSQALEQCPEGWRLPSDEDWKRLETALGMSRGDADKEGWRDGAATLMTQSMEEGTGLNMKYGGQLCWFGYSTDKYHEGDYGYYWSSTVDETKVDSCVFVRIITPSLNKVERVPCPIMNRYMSVRYVRDAK